MTYIATLERVQESILRDTPALATSFVRPKPHLSVEAQLSIYTEGYKIRLGKAVEGDYPYLAVYVGAARMDELIAGYIKATPSRSYNLDFYPFGFWRYVQKTCPEREISALVELEGSVAEIFMLPDSPALALGDLGALDEESLGRLTFKLRTASRLLALNHVAEACFQSFKRGSVEKVVSTNPTHLCIVRHNHEVHRHVLDPDEHRLLQLLDTGIDLGRAIEDMRGDETWLSKKIATWLPKWINEGFFRVA